MKQPIQITFRNVPHSDALEAKIREKAEKLDEFYGRIMSCRVTVEAPHGQHHQGNLYQISVDLTVPDAELVVNRSPKEHHAHEDPYVAVRDAFNAARRKLQDYARKQRGKVKSHEPQAHGNVSEIVEMEDYGRIVASDGREIYFHRNSIIGGDFDSLEVGSEVRFVEAEGDAGAQASTVHIVGKHHIVD